jgi:hypothetical protein
MIRIWCAFHGVPVHDVLLGKADMVAIRTTLINATWLVCGRVATAATGCADCFSGTSDAPLHQISTDGCTGRLMAVTKEVPMQSSKSVLSRSVARVNEGDRGTLWFELYHETKRGRGTGADHRPDDSNGAGG